MRRDGGAGMDTHCPGARNAASFHRLLALGLTLVCLLAAALTPGCRPQPTTVSHRTPVEDSVGDLRDQVAALEFLNRLQLTPDQVQRMLPVLQEAARDTEQIRARVQTLHADLAALLEQRRDALLRDETPPQGLISDLQRVEADIRELSRLDPVLEQAVAEGLREVLDPEQVALAVGGLEARIQASEILDGFRELRGDEFEAQVGVFVQELASNDAPMSPDETEALLRDARTLSWEEYQRDKSKLVDALQPLFAPAGEAADRLLVYAFTRPHVLQFLEDRVR